MRDRKSAFTHVNMFVVHVSGGPQKLDHFQKFLTRVCDDAEQWFIHQNIQYYIWSKSIVLNFINLNILCTHPVKTILH